MPPATRPPRPPRRPVPGAPTPYTGGIMSFSIFDHGDGRFRLVRDDREVGWVEDRTIGFRGFADADEARDAATTAYTALASWSARQLRTEPVPPRRRRLSVRREGAVEWLTLGGVEIGRLRRFGTDDLPGAEPDFGFELHLPARVSAAHGLSAAQAIGRALAARTPEAHVPADVPDHPRSGNAIHLGGREPAFASRVAP